VTRGDTLALEGFETRLWTVRDTANGNRLKSGTMPPEIIAAFAGG
jgi:4-hydroxybenzoyl-CoA thioesterase